MDPNAEYDLEEYGPCKLPHCQVCRKQSDSFKILCGIVLCGAHYDEAYRAGSEHERADKAFEIGVRKFVMEQRNGKFKPCWEE